MTDGQSDADYGRLSYRLPYDVARCRGSECAIRERCARYAAYCLDVLNRRRGVYTAGLMVADGETCEAFIQYQHQHKEKKR